MKLQAIMNFNNGVGKIINRRQYDSLTKDFNGLYDLTLSKRRKKRSDPQRKYYFGIIVAEVQALLIESQGEFIDKDEVHNFLKLKFNYKEIVNKKTGEIIHVAKSTTELSTVEQEEYNDKIRDWVFDFFDVRIPLPNEQSELIL